VVTEDEMRHRSRLTEVGEGESELVELRRSRGDDDEALRWRRGRLRRSEEMWLLCIS